VLELSTDTGLLLAEWRIRTLSHASVAIAATGKIQFLNAFDHFFLLVCTGRDYTSSPHDPKNSQENELAN
jgi:hypothetical protein